MANETKTVNIVRKHFEKYNDIIIEEQQSDRPKINKLLKNASKKGNMNGRPEFIITYKNNPDLLIVVECKADIRKHESKTRGKFAEYAVDGVLLYSSFLSKEFDVLAIAVSGETLKELKVSHFLNLKGDYRPAVEKFANKLLDADSYLQGYIQSPEKFKQDYDKLLSFSKELNETLHSEKVKESQRSLLISGVLIALENAAFKKSYKLHTKPDDLANALVNTITDELKTANLTGVKLENLKSAYSYIKIHSTLSVQIGVLSSIIDSIDRNINSFIKTHKYRDVLGQFYIEFLRYANNDKGLGIVLTPPHITELFSELAKVNKDDIIYDNCAGTGGFLISAMKLMIADAKGDKDKEKSIKQYQLHGVEFQDDIFALACSNMFIHQDGKNNIINGDCFDNKSIDQMQSQKPTVGFLNPPYPKLPPDHLELEFVLNNLEVLTKNATCIAIVPISCVLAIKGKDFELKKKILESHTLEAVLSMPEQLFYNSNVGVVTAILIITAHRPHPPGKKTWFGYFRNDGFTIQKHKGRGDWNNHWQDKKDKWLKSYHSRDIVNGLSVAHEVAANQEWCAEAFMNTNYANLTSSDFIKELKKYAAFSISISE
jgi:type I restriction-modification system DNA methylase subunit